MEFIATGTLGLHGVTFYIEANSRAEAEEKARKGEYSSYDIDGASSNDWDISGDIEANE